MKQHRHGVQIACFNNAAAALLKEVFQRATNLWPDAPPEIKELADLVIDGEIKQNYWAQDTSPKSKQREPNKWIRMAQAEQQENRNE